MTGDTSEGRPAAELAAVVGGDVDADRSVTVRQYDPESAADRETLWSLKRAFETELGGVDEGASEKAAAYDRKLTDDYRARYLSWVRRCVADGPAVWLAVDAGDDPESASSQNATGEALGYAFLLPERLAMIWDGAVLNELYVVPAARGTGVADALVGAVVDEASRQETPMDRLLLDVAPDNDRARGFYERVGFEHWGEMVARDL